MYVQQNIERLFWSKEVDETLKSICLEISKRYEISFLEIGTDRDHVHFLIQSVPKYSVTEIIRMIKSITAKKIFEKHPEVKKQLWGGFFTNSWFLPLKPYFSFYYGVKSFFVFLLTLMRGLASRTFTKALYIGKSRGPSYTGKDLFYFYKITSNSKEIEEKYTFI